MADKDRFPEWQIYDKRVMEELETLYLEQADELKETGLEAREAWFMGIVNFAIAVKTIAWLSPNFDEEIEAIKPLIENRKISQSLKESMLRILEAAKRDLQNR